MTNTKIVIVKKMNLFDEIILEHDQNENQVRLTFKKAGDYKIKLQFTDLQGNEYPIDSRFIITDA